ncbi:MAG: DegV family protein [Dehalococcoidales bacterium]|nr:DegV family protein [Dehalococcoidales bacterium]
MAVKIVTDSSADLPAELAQEMGITVVPLYVRFGDEVYRERVSITDDEFYHKLIQGPVHPVTIQPSPQDFIEAYSKLSPEADGIVSIHLSSKLSGTYNSAIQGREMMEAKCPIEIVDSGSITMAMGLVCIAAAEAAKAGKNLEQVLDGVKQDVPNAHLLGLFDTLKYLQLGGRIGKAKALLGSILNVKPLITLKDGEVAPAGQVRTRAKGIERLVDFVKNAQDIESLAVGYSTTPDEAQSLAKQLSAIFTKEPIKIARLGTTLGVHAGPGTLLVAFRGKLAE